MKTPETKLYVLEMSIYQNGTWKAILFKDIIYLRASEKHTEIAVRDNRVRYYVSQSLDRYEKELPAVFYRSHRAAILNMACIQKIDRWGVYMENGNCLPIARDKYHLLLEKVTKLPMITVPICPRCDDTCEQIGDCETIRPFLIMKDKPKNIPVMYSF